METDYIMDALIVLTVISMWMMFVSAIGWAIEILSKAFPDLGRYLNENGERDVEDDETTNAD